MLRSPWTTARIRQLSALFIALTIWLSPSSFGQTNPQTATRKSTVASVPFVGCESDGQVGPVEAPTESDKVIQIDPGAAQRLAYYKSANSPGILAPRDWHCFGTYGSSGSSLFVTREPIGRDDLFSPKRHKFTGNVVQVDDIFGDGSGRYFVAPVIALVFPKQQAFVQGVIEELRDTGNDLKVGPYPKDKLIYKSDRVVEYQTPANSEGLGTISRLQKNNESIEGLAILQHQPLELLFLSVRLPPNMKALKSQIIGHLEAEGSSQPSR
jgi:hypothetical protein